MDHWTAPDFLSADSADDCEPLPLFPLRLAPPPCFLIISERNLTTVQHAPYADLASLSSFLQDDPKATHHFADIPPVALGGFVGGGGSTLADASSPELTSDSASPSSSDGNANTSLSAPAADSYGTNVPKSRGRRSSPTRASQQQGAGVSADRSHGAHDPKRKNGAGTAGAIKDHRRTSDSGAGHHSHATVDDGVTARSASSSSFASSVLWAAQGLTCRALHPRRISR